MRLMIFTPGRPCGELRSPRGRVRCELPPEHDGDFFMGSHIARGRDGRWISWPAEPLAVRVHQRQARVEVALAGAELWL